MVGVSWDHSPHQAGPEPAETPQPFLPDQMPLATESPSYQGQRIAQLALMQSTEEDSFQFGLSDMQAQHSQTHAPVQAEEQFELAPDDIAQFDFGQFLASAESFPSTIPAQVEQGHGHDNFNVNPLAPRQWELEQSRSEPQGGPEIGQSVVPHQVNDANLAEQQPQPEPVQSSEPVREEWEDELTALLDAGVQEVEEGLDEEYDQLCLHGNSQNPGQGSHSTPEQPIQDSNSKF